MAENGWDEMKRVIEYRLDNYDRRLARIDEVLAQERADALLRYAQLREDIATLKERNNRGAMFAGAITGFIAGLTGWLK